MNPYEIDIDELKESEEIKDEKELLKLKLKLGVEFLKAISKMKMEEVLLATGLHKSDLSRLRSLTLDRFTIDRIVGFLGTLGFSTSIKIKPKKAS